MQVFFKTNIVKDINTSIKQQQFRDSILNASLKYFLL